MLVIGIAGGIASGKTLVAECLENLGVVLIDADRIGHEVLQQADIANAIRTRWGETIIHSEGQIRRDEIAKRVFAPPPGGPVELAFLEKLTHPRIGEHLQQELRALQDACDTSAVTLDAAVMFKAGWSHWCTHILFVDTPHALRIERARQRGWTGADLIARESSQTPLEIKRQAADYVIDNSGTPKETQTQVKHLWDKLKLLVN
ncbi:MAG: dephospho-CoA kinase [Planctomycetota bacterium]|nr:dephospho-CoA kinase [Planctomycetota bacterium]